MKKIFVLIYILIMLSISFSVIAKPKNKRKYDCKKIGVQKIKNKKFKIQKTETIIIKKEENNFIPVRSPRFCFHSVSETKNF